MINIQKKFFHHLTYELKNKLDFLENIYLFMNVYENNFPSKKFIYHKFKTIFLHIIFILNYDIILL